MQNDKQKFKEEFEKRLVKFSLSVIKLCKSVRENRNLSPIADQLICSATSIGANVVEARGSGTTKDYIRFFEYSLKSANETKYWLLLIKESEDNLKDTASILLAESTELSKIIRSSILTMKGKG